MYHGRESTSTVEAIGTPGNQARLVVEAFGKTVTHSGLHVGQYAILEPLDGASELGERLQPGACGPTDPVSDLSRSPGFLAVVQGSSKSLFEQISSVDTPVG